MVRGRAVSGLLNKRSESVIVACGGIQLLESG
jgi:hypothetical protein